MRRMPGMMTCEAFDAEIPDYLDGTLTAARRPRVERHLRLCSSCRSYLAAYQQARLAGIDAIDASESEDEDTRPPERLISSILRDLRH